MSAYQLHRDVPTLDRPVLVVMLTGWVDASGAGAAAVAAVNAACNTELLATFDGDAFIDYRARRPTMELREGVNSRLEWGDIQLRVGADPKGTAVLTLVGPEPDSQWRRFAASVAELATQLGVYQTISLGAYPFATPHSRTSRISITSPSADVVASLPFIKSTLDVPAGMSSVLEHAFTEAGIASVGLWVQVPHYVSAMSYPGASVALLDAMRSVTGVDIPVGSLARDADIQRSRIDQLVDANDDHGAMVRQLEAAYDLAGDDESAMGGAPLPSGDEIAAEFERFLREQEG
ncbi:MAG: PAC2 family protein [Actinomycetota bacterium]